MVEKFFRFIRRRKKLTNICVRVIDCHILYLEHDEPLYLMLKRSENQIYPGIWQCVTGKIEPDEKPYETAIRELNEETGLEPLKMWSVDRVNHYYEAVKDRMNLIPVFGVSVSTKTVKLSLEHVDYKWCPVEEAGEMMLWDQQKTGLLQFHKMITNDKAKMELTEINF